MKLSNISEGLQGTLVREFSDRWQQNWLFSRIRVDADKSEAKEWEKLLLGRGGIKPSPLASFAG